MARGFLVGNVGVGRIPLPVDYMNPPGYNSRDAGLRKLSERIRRDPLRGGGVDTATYEAILQANRIIAGSPDTVIKKLHSRVVDGTAGDPRRVDQRWLYQPRGYHAVPDVDGARSPACAAGHRARTEAHRPIPDTTLKGGVAKAACVRCGQV